MRSLLVLLFQIIVLQDSISQFSEKIIPIDTTTFHEIGSINTWFQGDLDDTIITYKRVSIDSIISKHNHKECDTVFLIQYYDEGRRYINGKLHDVDTREQQYGFLFKNKRNGLWDFTGSPSYFSNGTLSLQKYYYYNDVLLPGFFRDKYYFINDTLTGFILTDESNIDSLTVSIHYSCRIIENGSYVCDISLENGLFINQVPLEDLKDESDLILSGYYNREIMNKITKHNR